MGYTKQNYALMGHISRCGIQAVCFFIIAALFFPSTAYATNTSKYYDYVLENNRKMQQEDKNPDNYLAMDQSDFKELSNKIVSGVSGDYQKVKAIYKWVCENIYYDYYAYETGDFLTNTPEYTVEWLLENKRGVCSYYAAIFERLVRAQGIPCRTVSGYAIDYQTDSTNSKIDFTSRTYALIQDLWTEANYLSDANHAWNEAYVDGRWINIDTTWDSSNEYTADKKYIKMDAWYAYFDVSDEQFAKDHKILEYGNHQEIAEREYKAFLESLQGKQSEQGTLDGSTVDLWDLFLENEYQSEANYYKGYSSTTTITTTTTTTCSGTTTETKQETTVENWDSSDFEGMEDLQTFMDKLVAAILKNLGE